MDRFTNDDYYGDDGIPGSYPERNTRFYEPPVRQRRGSGIIYKLWRLMYPVLIHSFGIEIISTVFVTLFLTLSVLAGMFLSETAAYEFIYENQIAIVCTHLFL